MIRKDIEKKERLQKVNGSELAKKTATIISNDRSESIIRDLRLDWNYDRSRVQSNGREVNDKNA